MRPVTKLRVTFAIQQASVIEHTRTHNTQQGNTLNNHNTTHALQQQQMLARQRRKRQAADAADELSRAAKFTFSVPLKARDKPARLPDGFDRNIGLQYINQYVEALGIQPTAAVTALVCEKLPRERIEFIAAWRAHGWRQ
jgi:hypothetical protein